MITKEQLAAGATLHSLIKTEVVWGDAGRKIRRPLRVIIGAGSARDTSAKGWVAKGQYAAQYGKTAVNNTEANHWTTDFDEACRLNSDMGRPI